MTRKLVAAFIASFVLCANAFGHGGGVDKNGCHIDNTTSQRHCHPERAKMKQLAVCDGEMPEPGAENALYGRVTGVIDGDTFKAKIQGTVMEFRLADLDAPERKQPYGPEARAMLAAALEGKGVVMLRVDNDSYGRIIVHVWIADLHINREIVSRGAAWFYPEYAHDNCLYEVENEARDAKRGLWALQAKDLVEPWVWRQRKRDAANSQHSKKKPPAKTKE